MDRNNNDNDNNNDPNNQPGGGSGNGGGSGGGNGGRGRASTNYDSDSSDGSDSHEPMRPWAADSEYKAMRIADPSPQLTFGHRPEIGGVKPSPQESVYARQKVRPETDVYTKPVIRRNQWKNPVLVQVPMYHKVDPYHIELTLSSGKDLSRTLETLTDIFRRESVQANCFNNPIKAALLSMDNNELQLAVWKSPTDESKIIVEIQRCRGDLMHCIRKSEAILDALKSEMTTESRAPASHPDVPFQLHPDGLEKVEELLNKANEPLRKPASPSSSPRSSHDEISVAPLEMIRTLFLSDRWDSRRLGLESLLIMSDPRRSDLATVIETGYAVLMGSSPRKSNSYADEIHDVIFRIVLQRKFKMNDPREPASDEIDSMEVDAVEHVNFQSDDEDEDSTMTDAEGGWIEAAGATWRRKSDYDEYMSGLFHIALATLTNAVSVALSFCGRAFGGQDVLLNLSAESVANEIVSRANRMINDDDQFSKGGTLIPVLVRSIRRAHNKHPNATLACTCLRYLCSASPSIRGDLSANNDVKDQIKKAIKIGRACHQQLYVESSELFNVLGRI